MNLEMNTTNKNGQIVLCLSGEIDAYTAPKLKETLNDLTIQENQEIIVDMENVNYMDSTGLGLFIGALKSVNQYNGRLEIINLQERVYRLFQITGLNEIMNLKSVVKEGEE